MPHNPTAPILRDQEFGRWTVIGDVESDGKRQLVPCRCQCGTERKVRADALRSGDSTSCGCFAREFHKSRLTRSDLSRTYIYRIWWHIVDRCCNPECPAYENYGGRGIRVCDRWRDSVEDFCGDILASIGERPSPRMELDRIENDGNYEPGNVRWATRSQQARNRRATAKLTLSGVTRPMADWAEITGIKYYTLKMRKQLGWSDEKTLTTPVGVKYIE